MDNHFRDLANRLFQSSSAGLTELEQKVIRDLAERRHISRNINREFDEADIVRLEDDYHRAPQNTASISL